jgi:hypothetical protein
MSGTAATLGLISIGTISGNDEELALQTSRPLDNGVRGKRLGGIGPAVPL